MLIIHSTMDAEIIKKQRGVNLLYKNYRYKKDRQYGPKLHWRCVLKGCPARVHSEGSVEVGDHPTIVYSTVHSHMPDAEDIISVKVKSSVCQLASMDLLQPLSQVYKEFITGENAPVNRDGAIVPDFGACRSMMHRARHAKMLPVPKIIADIKVEGEWSDTHNGLATMDTIDDSKAVNLESPYSKETLVGAIKDFIPQLTYEKHKGQAGRIGVLGGCQEYTGAPYFAAISALKVGCDLSHVFCMKDAAPVIKAYSPELIVHPILDHPHAVSKISSLLPTLHCVVIGPGLGRETQIFHAVRGILDEVKKLKLPVVVDADGLFFLTQEPEVIRGYQQAILTPNIMEFGRLEKAVFNENKDSNNLNDRVSKLSEDLGNVTIVCKGKEDIISNGRNVLVCRMEGSSRRCGGQGDLLSGSMGIFSYWAHAASQQNPNSSEPLKSLGAPMLAGYAACLLTRECSRLAFCDARRSMTTSDMINKIHVAFEAVFEHCLRPTHTKPNL